MIYYYLIDSDIAWCTMTLWYITQKMIYIYIYVYIYIHHSIVIEHNITQCHARAHIIQPRSQLSSDASGWSCQLLLLLCRRTGHWGVTPKWDLTWLICSWKKVCKLQISIDIIAKQRCIFQFLRVIQFFGLLLGFWILWIFVAMSNLPRMIYTFQQR